MKNSIELYKKEFRGFGFKEHEEYYQVVCPHCRKLEAFLYKDSYTIRCNRRNKCGKTYKLQFSVRKQSGGTNMTMEEYLQNHGIDLQDEAIRNIFGNSKSYEIRLRNGFLMKLKWDKKAKKYKYILPKGWKKSDGDFIPTKKSSKHPKDRSALYIMAGITDWLKAIQDGLHATTSLFGEGYLPQQSTVQWMKKYGKVVIVYDNDLAGIKGRIKLCCFLRRHGVNAFVKDMSSSKNVNDYCDFRKVHSLDFFLKKTEYVAIDYIDRNITLDTMMMRNFLEELYGDMFCLVEDRRVGVFDGKAWSLGSSDEIVSSMMSSISLALQDFMAVYSVSDDTDKKFIERLAKFRKKFDVDTRMKKIISSMFGSISYTVLPIEKFESNPYLFLAKNCVVDLRDRAVLGFDPKYRMIRQSDVVYDKDAKCDRWERFISEIFDGDKEKMRFVQKALGYSITGLDTEHAFFVCIGDGRNGKSLMLKVISHILGSYSSQISFSAFVRNKNAEDNNHDLADLVHKRFIVASESSETRVLNEAKLKAVTGGEKIRCRKLYKEFFEYSPLFKIWLTTNYKPKIIGTDNGIWRRMKLIPFEVSFVGKEDPKLFEKLIQESSGILNWLIEGFQMYLREGLSEPACIQKAVNEYRNESDAVQRFLDDVCEVHEDKSASSPFFVKSSELYQKYVEWVKENGEVPFSNVRFVRTMKQKGFAARRTMSCRIICGVRIVRF